MSERLCQYEKTRLWSKHRWDLHEDHVVITTLNFRGKETSTIQIGLSTCSSGFDHYAVPGIRLGQFLFAAIGLLMVMFIFVAPLLPEGDGVAVTDNGFGLDDVIGLMVTLFFGGLLLFLFAKLFVRHRYASCKKKNGDVSFNVICGRDRQGYEAFLSQLDAVLKRQEAGHSQEKE
jgi:hypothetical protein